MLNKATLHLKRGRRYGLCGANGAGKVRLAQKATRETRAAHSPANVSWRAMTHCELRFCWPAFPWSSRPGILNFALLPSALQSTLMRSIASGKLDGFPPKEVRILAAYCS